MYKATAAFHSERAGFFAACLYNVSFYAGVTAGIYLMPDSPQMVFWTFSLWMISLICKDDRNWKAWLVFGASAGLCIMSKVHGVFLWGGLGLFILFKKREWLRLPHFYAAAFITLIIISPILFWNIQNDFATYRFHSKRVTLTETTESNFSFFQEVLHQTFFNNPLNVFLSITGLVALLRNRIERFTPLIIFSFIGLPLVLILLVVSTFRDTVLIHWSGPAYVSLIPLAAMQLALLNKDPIFPRLLKIAAAVYIILLFSWVVAVNFYTGTWGSKQASTLGWGDISLDTKGWKEAGEEFKQFYNSEVANGRIKPSTPMTSTYWWGAHVEYYFCRPTGMTMIGLGPINQVHQYHWFNKKRLPQVSMDEAYCIMPSDDNYRPPLSYYDSAQVVRQITIYRSGKPAHTFRVYRLWGWKGFLQHLIDL
jgi:hypothetical protein